MTTYSFRTLAAGFFVAVGLFIPLVTPRTAAAYSTGSTGTQTILTEAERTELLETLLDKLIDLLEQLYPQIDWSVIRNTDSTDNSGDNGDDDSTNDAEDGDDDDTGDEQPTATAPVGTNAARANFEIPLSFSAFGNDTYIEKSVTRDASVSSSDGITYVIEDGAGNVYSGGTASAAFTSGSESGDTSGYFKIGEGDDRDFMLSIALDNDGATSGYYRAHVVGIAFDDDASAGGEDTITTIFSKTKTPVVFVNDEN